MSQETITPRERLVGNSIVDWALDGINGGEIADGMREVIDIHLAAQQVVASSIDGSRVGSFRVTNLGFLTTTASGELMRMYLNGYLETDKPMPRLDVSKDGTISKRGRVAVNERDLDFELTGMQLEEDGSRTAWFRWLPQEEIVQEAPVMPAQEAATGFFAHHPRLARLVGASAVTS